MSLYTKTLGLSALVQQCYSSNPKHAQNTSSLSNMDIDDSKPSILDKSRVAKLLLFVLAFQPTATDKTTFLSGFQGLSTHYFSSLSECLALPRFNNSLIFIDQCPLVSFHYLTRFNNSLIFLEQCSVDSFYLSAMPLQSRIRGRKPLTEGLPSGGQTPER